SWRHMVVARLHREQFDNIIPGALKEYDLPVVAAALAPRPLILASLSDSMGHILDPEVVRDEYQMAIACYELLGVPERLTILERPQDMSITKAYARILTRTE
ncbi:MAG: alpha/beta hydrolase family protein, partial [bacterium]